MNVNVMRGDNKMIEVTSSDGTVISTMVRMSFEYNDVIGDSALERIKDLFEKFCNEVEELF